MSELSNAERTLEGLAHQIEVAIREQRSSEFPEIKICFDNLIKQLEEKEEEAQKLFDDLERKQQEPSPKRQNIGGKRKKHNTKKRNTKKHVRKTKKCNTTK